MADEIHVTVENGEVQVWLDKEENCFMRAISKYGDPVELTEHDLGVLIAGLQKIRAAMLASW